MKKLIERLLVFIIAIPAFFALVLYLPHFNNLALNLVVIFFSAVGAIEYSTMLEKKQIKISKVESGILGALIPLSITLVISFSLSAAIILGFIVAGLLWSLMSRIFSKQKDIENIAGRITGCFSLFLYPGFFMGFIVLMSGWGNPAAVLLFLFIIFGNDSLAWLFGTLFGANNKGVIAVSPNKSIAGFIGGMTGSILVALCASFFFPSVFSVRQLMVAEILSKTIFNSILIPSVVLGLCTGVAAILGDLAESAIKRSCDFKDSGNFMLGRGGVLDSIDSIAAAAPIYYILFNYFFYVI
ncbi:MAG: phosphatidate cytidylyltransferase [Treponema sp.]|nr:phosphatidate cytidylyltransferase [Treponema sp.]MCL2236987.1 phosphatidate cytidylyltransferase [Treponema sp.]